MFGGTAVGESSARTHATEFSETQRYGQTSLVVSLLLGGAGLVAGLALAVGPVGGLTDEALMAVRLILLTTGGVVCFGAGLLQLATWRICREPGSAHRGAALSAVGFVIAVATQLSPAWAAALPVSHHTLAWGFGCAVIWAAATTIALVICLSGFLEAAADEEERRSCTERALRAVTEASQTQQTQQRERRHDVHNSLCALRMATTALAQIGDKLDEETRAGLRGAMLEEVVRLDQLIGRTANTHASEVGAAKERSTSGYVPAQRRGAGDLLWTVAR